MNLSKREKVMLFFLGISIIVGALYYFMLKPQLDNINKLKEEAEFLQEKVNTTKRNLDLRNEVEAGYTKAYKKVNSITKHFFPVVIQEKFIEILDRFIVESDIELLTISFTDIDYTNLKEEIEKESTSESSEIYDIIKKFNDEKQNTINDTNNIEKTELKLKNISATMYIEGTYDNIIKFIKKVESNDKKIIIKNVNLMTKEDDILSGNIILSFYAVPKLFIQDLEYFKWNYDNDYGRENPFINDMETEEPDDLEDNTSGNEIVNENYDISEIEFGMWVKPISSDLPTIALGEFEDRFQSTYVYADNIGLEDIFINLKKENDKYLYRYNTKSESYPKQQGEYEEFKVKGGIIEIKIYSAKRNSSDDVSGARITIENFTDLRVKIIIKNDDEYKPRVNIIYNEGNVVIIRES